MEQGYKDIQLDFFSVYRLLGHEKLWLRQPTQLIISLEF